MAFSTEAGRPIRVFVVDDHDLVRRGLQDLLYFEDDMLVVGEAAGVADARKALAEELVDVAVVDLMLTDGTGIELCRWIRSTQPDVAILVITSLDDSTALRSTILAGAAGYLSKLALSADAADAIRQVAAGNVLLDPSLFSSGHAQLREVCETDTRLTELERTVFGLALDGATDGQIAARLGLPMPAVSEQLSDIVEKIELIRSRTGGQPRLSSAH
jgi:two-component system response regulator DevR